MILALLLLGSIAQNPPSAGPDTPQVIDRHPNPDGQMIMTFDLHDLLPPLARKEAGPKGLGYIGDVDPELEAQAKERAQVLRFLEDTLTSEVQPPAKEGEFTLRGMPNGTLVAHARREQQEWLRATLERARSGQPRIVTMMTWIEGPKGAFGKMGFAADGSASVISKADEDRLLGLQDGFEVRTAPRMALHPIAVGSLIVGESVAYVKSWSLITVEPGDAKVADPEIGRVMEGIEMSCAGLVLDGQRVALDLHASSSAVRRPIATRQVRLDPASSAECTVALPEVERKSVDARCTLAPGGVAALGAACAGKADREFLILIRASVAPDDALQAPGEESAISGAKRKGAK